jgi:hypothetical protein
MKIIRRRKKNENSALKSSGNDDFEDDMLILSDYSFISVNEDKITFEMHGLVQLITRMWLKVYT